MGEGTGRVTGWASRLRVRHLFGLVPFVLISVAAVHPVVDNSFLWHVRAGTAQLRLGRVLTSDVFSYSRGGVPWRTQSWLTELGYGTLERLTGGIAWTHLVLFLVAGATLLLVGVRLYGVTRSPLATALWMMVLAWLAVPFVQPRPVVVSYVLLALVVVVVGLEDRVLWAAVPIVWIWSAMHGSWVLGVGLLLLEAVRRRSRRVALVAILGAVAATATAHGLGVWEILLAFARNRDALALINEWRPPAFGDPVQAPYLVLLVGILVGASRHRLRPRYLVVVVPFLLFGLTTRRAVYPAAIVLVPWAALAWRPRRAVGGRGSAVTWVAAGVVAALVVAPLLLVPHRIDTSVFPPDAAIAAAGPQPFFHSDAVGGYLIYRNWPAERIYLDDRAELYGAEFFAEYLAATRGAYEPVFSRYGMRAAIASVDWPLVTVLERDGWRTAYRDEHFVVLRAP